MLSIVDVLVWSLQDGKDILHQHCLWSPCAIEQAIIFLPCGFFFLLSFFARLISVVGDWMSTILPHMVWP